MFVGRSECHFNMMVKGREILIKVPGGFVGLLHMFFSQGDFFLCNFLSIGFSEGLSNDVHGDCQKEL